MKQILTLVLLLSFLQASANDGVFYAQGNTLVPVKETTVEMQKEILRLTRRGDFMEVEVDFTFYNPGPEKTEIVGFVTPPAAGDVDEDLAQHPFVSDFTVNVNGYNLSYEIARMENTGFQLQDQEVSGSDFVYHFGVTFHPGMNQVRHTYKFRGGSSVEFMREFSYRLTTGTMWAKGVIGDFTLEVDMGPGDFFSLPNSFYKDGSALDWQTSGGSHISAAMKGFFEQTVRMGSQNDGIFSVHIKDFKPDYDLAIFQYQVFNEVFLWTEDRSQNPFLNFEPMFLLPGYAEASDLEELSKSQLGMLRNYYFARQGHVFQSERYQKLFGGLLWYQPQPGKEVELDESEAEYVALIKSVEDQKQ